MSKTIMITDETYEKLKKMKEASHMSFTQLMESFLIEVENKKRVQRLLALKGTWKPDPKEDKEVEELLREGWKKWSKKYA